MALRGALGLALVAHDAAALCVAGVALGDIYVRFTWQAWHNLTSTFVLRGRHGTHGTGWRAWARFGTISHTSLSHTICQNLSHTIFHTDFVTHHLSYNLCQQFSHAHLCHTPSVTSFTHTLSHTNFHTQLCRTPSFTYYLSRYNTLVCSSLVRMSVSSTSRFGSSKSDWSRKPFGHQIHVSFAGMFT